MTGQIKRPLGSITLVTMLLVSFVGITVLANTAGADDCIAAPNSPSPPGKHWYYRLDWATKRKCWYLGPLGRSVQEAAPSATKGRVTRLRSLPARPNQQLQADDPPLSPGEAGPSSPPLKAIAVKPNAASVSATANEATSSFPEISAPQASMSSETVTKGAAPGSSAGPASSATTDDAALSTPQASPAQASALSETGPTFGVGELTDNAWLPMISLLYLALGLAVVGILSFAVLRLFKNETNKMPAGADVTEVAALVAASMDLSFGRGCDSNGESGDLQQAAAFVLKEPGCARDSEESDEGTTPTLHDGADVTEALASTALRLGRGRDSNGESGVAHLRAGMIERLRAVHDKVCADLQQADAFVLREEVGCARNSQEPDEGATPTLHDQLPHAKLTFNEYRQRIDACLSWAQMPGAERVVCLELAQAWLQAALAHTGRNK